MNDDTSTTGDAADDSFAAMEAKEESLRQLNKEIDSQLKEAESSSKPSRSRFATTSLLVAAPPDDESPSSADALELEECPPPPMGAKATIRLQKAKIHALSSEVKSTMEAKQELETRLQELSSRLRDETKEKRRLTKALLQAKNAASKSKSSANSSGDTIESLRSELHAVKRELASCQKSLQIAEGEQNSRQIRLERALQEVNRVKKSVAESSERSSKATNGPKGDCKERDELQRKVALLEKQRSELLIALKKQQNFINVLQRQKIHAEAAKLLSFTEEAFVKEIGWGGRTTACSSTLEE